MRPVFYGQSIIDKAPFSILDFGLDHSPLALRIGIKSYLFLGKRRFWGGGLGSDRPFD